MNIGINASFLRKPHTGIGQVTTHFVDELIRQVTHDKRLKNHTFFLYTEEESHKKLPKNFSERCFTSLVYKRDDLFRKLLWEKIYLPRMAHKDRCDVLISLYQSATVISYTDMKHVMVVHDVIPRVFAEYLDNMRKKIYWHYVEKGIYASHKIVTVSAYTQHDLEHLLHVKPQKMTTSLIAVDQLFTQEISQKEMDRVMRTYHLTEGAYIYTGGGLELRKGVDRILRAYKMLKSRYPDAPKLVVSGKLMPQLAPLIIDVEQIVLDLHLRDDVIVTDFVPQEDLPALYKGAKMFVYASLYEGFGLPPLEAMTVGTPVITTHNTSIPEVCKDAVVYAEENDEDFARKMHEMLSDDTMIEEKRAAGAQRAADFSWETFVHDVMDEATQ